MKRYFGALTGNAPLAARVGAALSHGKLSHAYIIAGPRGSGKQTFARALCEGIACLNREDEESPLPCGVCRNCRRVAEGLCPDIIHVEAENGKETIGVDAVRSIRSSVAVVPNDLAVKIYVIHGADTMTVQAQNALLLTLEEPPPFVRFLLLAENADALLPTIRSRAPVLRMERLDNKTVAKHLLEASPAPLRTAAAAIQKENPAEFAALLMLADGAIGKAEELLDPRKRAPLMEERARVAALTEALAVGNNGEKILTLIGEMKEKREGLMEDLSLFQKALRDLILLEESENAPLLFFTDREAALDLAAGFSAEKLFSAYQTVENAMEALAANANIRLTVSRLVGHLLNR